MEKFNADANAQEKVSPRKTSTLKGLMAALAVSMMPVDSAAAQTSDVSKLYDAARQEVNSSSDAFGIFGLELYMPETGEVINLGAINTESESQLHEEFEIVPVLKQLGFSSPIEFAQAFNAKFSQRDAEKQDLLTDAAKYVDEKLGAHEDIKIGDATFKNFRLAVLIWLADTVLEQEVGDTVEIAGITFDVEVLKRKLPSLDIKEVMLRPSEAPLLKYLEQYLPDEVPVVEHGSLTIEKAKEIALQYVVKNDGSLPNYEYVYLLLGVGAYGQDKSFDSNDVVTAAFSESPYGDLSRELESFFHADEGYRDQRTEIRDFLYGVLDTEPHSPLARAMLAYEYEGG